MYVIIDIFSGINRSKRLHDVDYGKRIEHISYEDQVEFEATQLRATNV